MSEYLDQPVVTSRREIAKLLNLFNHEPLYQYRVEVPLPKLVDLRPKPVLGQPEDRYLAPRRIEAGFEIFLFNTSSCAIETHSKSI